MQKGICHISCIPMRSGPGSTYEMVSQLIMGECYTVIEQQESWIKIKTDFDSYEGWISNSQWFENLLDIPTRVITNSPVSFAIGKRNYILSMGSELGFEKETGFILKHSGEVVNLTAQIPESETDLTAMAQTLMNSPYLWGGRSFMGIDCSGFIQVLFKTKGLSLPRDAKDQVHIGHIVASLADTIPGDLAFFENEQGKITHVGLLLSPSQIVHASGMVRADRIDEQGIIQSESGKYSHKLKVIRRITI